MSLLLEAMQEVTMLEKRRVTDGEGGFVTEYIEGEIFNVAITYNNSIESVIAEKQGVSSTYLVTTSKNIVLEYHDIFKRKKDGKIFRVTSDGDDLFTPESSTLNMRQVTAEEYQL